MCVPFTLDFILLYLFIYLLFFHAVIRRLHGNLKKDERGILLINAPTLYQQENFLSEIYTCRG